MRWIALLLFAAGCAAATEPAQPPLTAVLARVRGTVVDARRVPVHEATVNVVIWPAQADGVCASTEGSEASGLTNERGEYDISVRWLPAARDQVPCVVITAQAGGTTGAATVRLNATSFDVQLDPAGQTTREESARIIGDVIAAIEGDQEAPARLASYVWGGRSAVEAAALDLRQHLGSDVSATDMGNTYRLKGSKGRSTDIVIQQEATIRLTNPFLFYSARARRFVDRMVQLISANDAANFARLLNPDDVDVPESEAQLVIDGYRQSFDPGTLTGTLLSWNERRSTIRYRLRGEKKGKPVQETIELVYGDGALVLSP
ncbi:MAG TPA: hypothetical protein VMS98_11565 [Thermoanaerobaculia bacterium]|nr:hypothetical protein [Thermoanaerobaculia bacterium]